MKPIISAFIVNYNTRAFLEQCIESIFDANRDLSVEVFVADNNSSDGSAKMVKARFPQVYLTEYSENIGYTSAINPLLPLANGDYCLLLHPDVRLLPKTLRRFVDFFDSCPRAGIVGGNLYYPDGTPNACEILWPSFKNDLLTFAVRIVNKLPGGKKLLKRHNPTEWSHKATSRVDSVWNACMMVRREVLEEMNYFDENFFYGSVDWDFCKRAADAGWFAYYVHPAAVIHYESQSYSEEESIMDEVRYKIDGSYSAVWIYEDRYVFLKKHCSRGSIIGAKTIYLIENLARLCIVFWNVLRGRRTPEKASVQARSNLKTIQAILKS